MSKIILLLLFIPLIANAVYSEGGFVLGGSAETGWVLITPLWDYFGFWLKDILGSMAINKQTKVAECWLIENGLEKKCSTQDFSILLANFPHKLINDLK